MSRSPSPLTELHRARDTERHARRELIRAWAAVRAWRRIALLRVARLMIIIAVVTVTVHVMGPWLLAPIMLIALFGDPHQTVLVRWLRKRRKARRRAGPTPGSLADLRARRALVERCQDNFDDAFAVLMQIEAEQASVTPAPMPTDA